jgi:hypothetical protein
MIKNKTELLIIRDVVSREVYELENKIMESRINKLKYKYLEDRKEVLVKFLAEMDIRILYEDEEKSTTVPLPPV